jgi:alpha/beta hydrolase family protein
LAGAGSGSPACAMCTGPGLGGSPPRPLAALMLATPARYYHPRLLALTVPHIAGGRTARQPQLLAEQAAARLSRRPDPLGYTYQLWAGLGWSRLQWLHRVQHQTLIVAGEQDPTVPPRNARLLAARLPHARLHVVKGGGHLFLLDEPENAAPAIRAFLDEDDGAMRPLPDGARTDLIPVCHDARSASAPDHGQLTSGGGRHTLRGICPCPRPLQRGQLGGAQRESSGRLGGNGDRPVRREASDLGDLRREHGGNVCQAASSSAGAGDNVSRPVCVLAPVQDDLRRREPVGGRSLESKPGHPIT